MDWRDQGRQYHMWFGHGPAGSKGELSKVGSDSMFEPGHFGQRIDAVAHGAIMHMPRRDWRLSALSFDRERLDWLRTAMTTWNRARSLSAAVFEAKLVDPLTRSSAVDALRTAANGAETAQNHEDLKDASAHLAAGMQGVGLYNWPGFLRDAADRAKDYQPDNKKTVLAQASLNTDANKSNCGAELPTTICPATRWRMGSHSIGLP